jgi:hypothetical protein
MSTTTFPVARNSSRASNKVMQQASSLENRERCVCAHKMLWGSLGCKIQNTV